MEVTEDTEYSRAAMANYDRDMVNHPPHYTQHPKGIEAIDVIEENPYPNLANAIKYIWRVSWGSKGKDIEDLKKARWYLNREIERRERTKPKS